MRSSPEQKNGLRAWGRRLVRGAGLLALTALLYGGDRYEPRDEVWVGPAFLQDGTPGRHGRSAPVSNPNHLRVATYNLKGGEMDRQGAIRKARTLGADVLGLTEAGGVYRDIAGSEYQAINGGGGNILLTNKPVRDQFSTILSDSPGKPRRTALFAKLALENRDQWFVLTHLEHNEWPYSAETSRLEQLADIQETIDDRLDGEPIILGDLNFLPGGRAYKRMDRDYDDAFETLGLGSAGTFESFTGLRRYDYILLDEELDYEVVAGGVGAFEGVSDHVPVQAVIDIEPERSAQAA